MKGLDAYRGFQALDTLPATTSGAKQLLAPLGHLFRTVVADREHGHVRLTFAEEVDRFNQAARPPRNV